MNMHNMKRFLSLILVLAMVLTGVPMAFASEESGLAIDAALPEISTEGPAKLPVDDREPADDGVFEQADGQVDLDTKLVNNNERISEKVDAKAHEASDVVTFIVEMHDYPLLEKFSADDIAAQTAAVTDYQDRQMVSLNSVKEAMSEKFSASKDFKIGYTYTIGTTGVSVTTEYGNKAAIEAIPGVAKVYEAPVFQLPETDGLENETVLHPMTGNATTMIGANILNETGFTGKGMRICIIDTGIVVDHPSFQALPEEALTDSSLTREEVDGIWETLNASAGGRNQSYYNTKIPFRYNYYSNNFDVSHINTAKHDHGTHVAGISAANKIDDTTVVGVAPDAQLIVMQTFQPGGGTGWDTILAALEDCVRLNVDAINMSLGATAGFTDLGVMLDVMNEFAKTDIELLIAAGNEHDSALGNMTGLHMAYKENPDTGVVGTPGTYSSALTVASIDNDGSKTLYFSVGDEKFGFQDTAATEDTKFFSQFKGETLEFVVLPEYGKEDEYADVDVTGKIAVVSRGGCTFPEKQTIAGKHGAVGVIVYNNVPGPFLMKINDGAGNIPCVSVGMDEGAKLKAIGSGELTVCNGDMLVTKLPKVLSSFSSWGVTPDLKLKPEIAGVGGNIYSSRDPLLAGSNYGDMSGTSMATPQVCGAAAIMMQYMRSEHPELKEAELRQTVANLMMSTANPVYNGNLEFSPRGQGAGLVDLVKGTTSPAYLTSRNAYDHRPKGEMGDDPEKTGEFTFAFEINNYAGTEDLTYTFDSSVMTETLFENEYIEGKPYGLETKVQVYGTETVDVLKYDFNADGEITTADARALLMYVNGTTSAVNAAHVEFVDVNADGEVNKADVEVVLAYCAGITVAVDMTAKAETVVDTEALTQVTVAPGETVALTAKVVLTEADKEYMNQFPNGIWAEGFLYAHPADAEKACDLVMPFVGFYGDWSDPDLFDAEDPAEAQQFPLTVMTMFAQVGTNPYFRNGKGGPEYNAYSYSNPLAEIDIGLLRNAKHIEMTVTDVETGEVYHDISGDYLTKTFMNPSYGIMLPLFVALDPNNPDELWDGMDAEGNKLPDGTTVKYETKGWLDDGDDIMDDSTSFEITLDSVFPKVLNADNLQDGLKLKGESVTLTLDIEENQHIAAVLFLDNRGSIMAKYEIENEPGVAESYDFDITGYGPEFTVVVADYACNETEVDVILDLGDLADKIPAVTKLDSDRLYGCETWDSAMIEGGWFSANKADLSDVKNETYDSSNRYYSAEFVNGYLVAQSVATGNLELVTPTNTFWSSRTIATQTAQEQFGAGYWVLYDMALDYTDYQETEWEKPHDRLFATGWNYMGDEDGDKKDDGGNWLFEIKFNDWGSVEVKPLYPMTGEYLRGEILAMGCTTEGQLYGIDAEAQLHKIDKETGVCELVGITSFPQTPDYSGVNVIQSMGYDHNTDTMYWYAHSQTAKGMMYVNVNMTYKVDLETGATTEVGTYGPGGQTCLFVPHDMESNLFTMGVPATELQINPQNVLMPVGQSKRLSLEWRPWNAAPAEVTWESSDPDVVSVGVGGYLKANSTGKATIMAHYQVMFGEELADRTAEVQVEVVPSNEELYSYLIIDFKNQDNTLSWITYSDQNTKAITKIGTQKVDIEVQNPETGETEIQQTTPIWQGGAYRDGYIYTAYKAPKPYEIVTQIYKSKVTVGDTPAETVIGEPILVGETNGIEVGNMAFDYSTSRMYGVDITNGGLCIIDLDNGSIDPLGSYTGDLGPAICPAMTVDNEGKIIVSDMFGSLYKVDPDTLEAKRVGSCGSDTWSYGAMLYDYVTENIYWAPCHQQSSMPVYLVRFQPDQWDPSRENAVVMDIGPLCSKRGAEQTVLFSVPDPEPEAHRIPVEGIKIDGGDVVGIVGGTHQMTATTTPLRPTVQTRIWSSTNSDIASIDRFGKITFNGVGECDIKVVINNKDPLSEGGPFEDTVHVKTYASAGKFEAFLGHDQYGTQYFDFWLNFYDYDLAHVNVGQSEIGNYTLRVGEYYDDYFYGYNESGKFMRIDRMNRGHVTTLGQYNLVKDMTNLGNMTMDYTTGKMLGVTLPEGVNNSSIVEINLDNGEATKILDLDQKIQVISVTKDGSIYAVGAADHYSDAMLYKVDRNTGACTLVAAMPGVRVGCGGAWKFRSQMAYEWTTDRLYLNATVDKDGAEETHSGLIMIQLHGDAQPEIVNLGKMALMTRQGSLPKFGVMKLSLLASIPENDELPVQQVNGLIMDKPNARLALNGEATLGARVRPALAENTDLIWSSDDASIVSVDQNGKITGKGLGSATITATAAANDAIKASCVVTVVDTTGPQSTAYTVSAQKDALISFNPELPSAGYEKIATLSGGSLIAGVAYDGKNGLLYATMANGPFPTLYRFDFDTQQSTNLGDLYCWVQQVDIGYDIENDLLAICGGFYIFQFQPGKCRPGELNGSLVYRDLDSSYSPSNIHAITNVGDEVYFLREHYGTLTLTKMDSFFMNEVDVCNLTGSFNSTNAQTEMEYDPSRDLFYITDAGNMLYSFSLDDIYTNDADIQCVNVTAVDVLAGNVDIHGLGIKPADAE